MKFSYSAVWNDAVQLIRSNSTILAALAGVFLFLPSLLTSYFLPQPEPMTPSEIITQLREYFLHNWHWVLLAGLVNMLGTLSILSLLLGRQGGTVGAIIGGAAALLPFYFLASLISGLLIGLGTVLLVVPGLYLFGRLAPLAPVVVAERRRNPIDAIKRTFEVTKGNGWRVLGLVILVGIAGFVLVAAATAVLGLLFMLFGEDIGQLLTTIVAAAGEAAVSTVLIALFAAIYRALSDRDSTATVFS